MKRIFLFLMVCIFLFFMGFHVSLPAMDLNTDAVSAATSKPTPTPTPSKPSTPATPATPSTPVTPAVPADTSSTDKPAANTPVTWASTPSSWADKEIQTAASYGLTLADLTGQYDRPLTRLEFVRLVMNQYYASGGATAGSGEGQPFSDTTDNSVKAAYYAGIIHGQGIAYFNPNSELTRQEAAVILFREWSLLNAENGDPVIYPRVFSDSDKISSWAEDAVRFMNQVGVLHGGSDGKINPSGKTTREQGIILVLRNYESLKSLADTASPAAIDQSQSTDATSSATINNSQSSVDQSEDDEDTDEDDDD